MDNLFVSQFIAIFFVFFAVVYTKHLLQFSTTILGKAVSVGIIAYYTTLHKLYGFLAAAILIYVHHQGHLVDTFLREGFGKDDFMQAHCDHGKLKYKLATVNPEMAEHVFPEIKYNDPEHRCNPCDSACDYTIMEDKIVKETEMILPKKDNGAEKPETSILDYWRSPAASNGVVSEVFSYFS